MKKALCVTLALFLALSLALGTAQAEIPGTGDIVMLYDCETNQDNGHQSPWAVDDGFCQDICTEGEYGIEVTSIMWPGLMLFHNLAVDYDTPSLLPDLTTYEYVEFDLCSHYDMVCDLELCLVADTTAHHGSDCEMFGVFLPAEQFVHVRMPIADFVTHSPTNRDKWDETNDTYGPETPNVAAHYSGYCLDFVRRIRFQLTYCTDPEGNEMDDISVIFDNITAVKNGATHAHIGNMELQPLQYWEDVKDDYTPSVPDVPSQPDVLPDPEVKRGDVNADGTVDARDALMVLKAAVGKLALTGRQKGYANLNEDEAINATDALIILKIAVGKA